MDGLPVGVFRICGKYRLRKKIGLGSFGAYNNFSSPPPSADNWLLIGDVYYANDVITGKAVAVKMESATTDHPKLEEEWRIYKKLGHTPGIPHAIWFGSEQGHKAIIMKLLGPSLEQLFNLCNRRFSLKTVLMLADQLVCLGALLQTSLLYVHLGFLC